MVRHVLCCLIIAALAGCASHEPMPVTERPGAVELSDRETVRDLLLQQYAQWEGTPHRMGGTSKSGIDCSALVQRTFLTRFGRELPRTTSHLVRVGKPISRDELRPGDLVFFKTGFKSRHVGIYTGGEKFFHASSSEGVSLTDINDPYWQSNYWQSRRVVSR